jgi:tetratricopeptide (TPR) repeat protein/predicted Ser/Thr protein kinase
MNLAGRSFGHIRVDHMLGQGGMGDVYQGFDVRLARRVALKVLNSEGQLDEEARTRLMREARTLSKLDHPNICRIYDFIDEGDLDVLVLELIDGRTLQEAMNDGLSWAEKLRIAHDVASVLVTAHRAGIVHRDLKPENVMLTASGQVKVLDFGLARWIKRKSGKSFPAIASPVRLRAVGAEGADATAILSPPEDAAAANATAVGLTVGTPLFMSPEQARGEPLTTASDIYSFGLLLQALFTGRDPYPDDLTAHQVMVKASRGDSLPVTGVGHDVAALIKACKALAPSDRPTAADTLRRIERIVETPKRVARRAAVIVLALIAVLGGWKYTVDLRRERTAAQKAEAEAKQRRADADSLIEFMLGDLRTKLEPVGRLDVLDAAAERSLAYMSSLNTDLMTPQEIARNSKALNQLGEVRMSQGNLPAAASVFNKSLALAQVAQKRAPNDSELALAVGTAQFWVASALQLKGDLPGALAHMREYGRITENLATRYPKNDEYQVESGYGHSGVATILESQSDLAAALPEYRLTLAVQSARLAAKPWDTHRQGDVAVTLNKIGFVLERLGRLEEARSFYEREFALYDSLGRVEPKNMHWKDRLANSHEYLAALMENLGEIDAGLLHASPGAQIYGELARHDPTNMQWQRNLATALNRHATFLLAKGDAPKALQSVGVAETTMRQLLKHENRPAWNGDLVLIKSNQARILLAVKDVGRARAIAAESAALADTLGSRVSKRLVGDAHATVAETAEAAHDPAAARVAWSAVRGALEPASVTTTDVRVLSLYARALMGLGDRDRGMPIIARLRQSGYRGRDLAELCAKRGC